MRRLVVALSALFVAGIIAASMVGASSSSLHLAAGDDVTVDCPNALTPSASTPQSVNLACAPDPTTTTTSTTTTTTAPTTTTTVAPTTTTTVPPSTKPGPTNTGPTGTLTVVNGNFTFTSNGQVAQNLDIRGSVSVNGHDNVTLRNSRVTDSDSWVVRNFLVNNRVGVNAILDHVEVNGLGTGPANNAAIGYANVTCRYCNIHGTTDGVRGGDNLSLEHSWVHDLVPASVNGGHGDGIQITDGGGGHITDSFLCGDNSAVFIKSDLGPIANVDVERNWLDCGNYTFYSRIGGSNPAPTGVKLINNRFGRHAQYGVCSIDGTVTRSGNVYDDNNAPACP